MDDLATICDAAHVRERLRTVGEYRHNAEQCRKLAKLLSKADDKKVLEMAEVWDKLAKLPERDLIPDDA
jgi:hypothetical protein